MLLQVETFFNLSKYAVAFLGAFFEGPIVMIGGGFLLRTGQFEFWPLYLSLVSGDFLADLGWYGVGRFAARKMIDRFGKFFNITPEIIEKIEKRFKNHQDKILIISKVTMGFGFALATLLVSGILHVPFKRYAFINLVGGFIWTGFLLCVGFFFGNIYTILPSQFKFSFVVLLIFTVLFLFRIINKYLVKKDL